MEGAVAEYDRYDIHEGVINAIQPFYTGRRNVDAVTACITQKMREG